MRNQTTRGYRRTAILSLLSALLLLTHPAQADDDCNLRHIADQVKTISILRKVESALNALALAQADAIVDIATGVHTLELYNDPSGFYGPLGGLRKTTDKNEAELGNLDKSLRRLGTFAALEPRYDDLRAQSLTIIAAGYAVLDQLETGDPAAATRVYASQTVIALNAARAEAYTAMSELERAITLAGLRCK